MYDDLFKTILEKKLTFLYTKTIEKLEKDELINIAPISELSIQFCDEKNIQEAKEIVKKKIEDTRKEVLYISSPFLQDIEKIIIKNHNEMVNEFKNRIGKHRNEICNTLLKGKKFTKINNISCGVIDTHNHGRITLIIDTDAGKFLYKPHSCMNNYFFYELYVKYFSDIIYIPKCLDFIDYGFCEFVENHTPETIEDAKKFYYNFGGFDAIFTSFGSCDLHYNNFVASYVYPTLIDFETIFTVRLKNKNIFSTAYYTTNELSNPLYTNGFFQLKGGFFNSSPILCKDRSNVIMPTINGEKKDASIFKDEFINGYDKIYDRCMNYKTEIIELIKKNINTPIRIVMRNSESYIYMLDTLNTPMFLQNKTQQEQIVNMFEDFYINENIYGYEKALRYEKDSIIERDIPYFYTMSDDCNLYGDKKILIENYCKESPIDDAIYNIRNLSCENKEKNISIIKKILND